MSAHEETVLMLSLWDSQCFALKCLSVFLWFSGPPQVHLAATSSVIGATQEETQTFCLRSITIGVLWMKHCKTFALMKTCFSILDVLSLLLVGNKTVKWVIKLLPAPLLMVLLNMLKWLTQIGGEQRQLEQRKNYHHFELMINDDQAITQVNKHSSSPDKQSERSPWELAKRVGGSWSNFRPRWMRTSQLKIAFQWLQMDRVLASVTKFANFV